MFFLFLMAVLENWIFLFKFKYLGAKMSLIKLMTIVRPDTVFFGKINNVLEMRMKNITVLLNKNKTLKMT